MPVLKPKIGREYLTASGLPERVAEIGDNFLTLQSLASEQGKTRSQSLNWRTFR